jgi:hypothetical protein
MNGRAKTTPQGDKRPAEHRAKLNSADRTRVVIGAPTKSSSPKSNTTAAGRTFDPRL